MSWTTLTLQSAWTPVSGYPAARVRPLSGISAAAQLEGCLDYNGSSTNVAVPLTNEASMPAYTFDASQFHTVEGRWYDASSNHKGTCEILVLTDGSLSVLSVPAGGVRLFFGDIYPVA